MLLIDLLNIFTFIVYLVVLYQRVIIRLNADFWFIIIVIFGVQSVLGSVLIDKLVLNSVQARASDTGIFSVKLATFVCLLIFLSVELIFCKMGKKFLINPKVSNSGSSCRKSLMYLSALNITVFVIMIALMGFPQGQLFTGLSSSDISFLRVNTLHSSSNISVLIKNALGYNLSLLVVLYSYCALHENCGSRILFVIAFGIGIYYTTFDLSKSKIFFLLISLITIKLRYDFLLGRGLAFGKYIILSAIGIGILIQAFILTMPAQSLDLVFEYLFMRTILSQISGAPHFFDYNWTAIEVIGFHVTEALQLGDFQAPGQVIMERLYPEAFSQGLLNFISIPAWYEAMAVFGFVVGGIILGFVYYLLRTAIHLRHTTDRNQRLLFTVVSSYMFCGSNIGSSILPFLFTIIPVIPILLLLSFQTKKIMIIKTRV